MSTRAGAKASEVPPRSGVRGGMAGSASKVLARLRAVNALLTVAMLMLFAAHCVANGLLLVGAGPVASKTLSAVLVGVAGAHGAMGIVLTVATFRAQRAAGVAYAGLNRRFWTLRISGAAVALGIVAHVLVFAPDSSGQAVLGLFGPAQLAANLVLVAAIAVHALCGLQPLMIALGVPCPRARAADAAVVAAVLLVFAAAAFAVYFARWAVV